MPETKRVFVSYVQENREVVALLVQELSKRSIDVWWDRDSLLPGTFWQDEIRRAIRSGEYFIACFSLEYLERDRTFMNEELAIAMKRSGCVAMRRGSSRSSCLAKFRIGPSAVAEHFETFSSLP